MVDGGFPRQTFFFLKRIFKAISAKKMWELET